MKTQNMTSGKVKYNKKTLAIVAIVVAVLGIALLVLTKAATPGTPAFGLYVSPSTASPAAGTQFNVSVYANLGNTSVQSMATYLIYDPTKLELVSANQTGVDPNYTVVTRCTAIGSCKPAGEIVFVAGYSGTTQISPADGLLIGNMTFKALATGPASLDFKTLPPPNNTVSDPSLSGFISTTTPQATLDQRTVLNGTFNIVDGTAPSVPTGLASPAKTSSTVNLSWAASNDNVGGIVGSGIAGYKIYRGGVQIGTSTGAGTTYQATGLSPSTAYAFTVASYDVAGNTSAPSSPALNVTTNADTQAPSKPGKPTASAITPKTLTLNWTASTDDVALAGYKILRNGTQIATTTGATSYNDSGLAPSTSYSYTIVAYDTANPANNSVPSDATVVTTAVDNQAPTSPSGLNATPNGASVSLTWTASSDDVAVTGYRILRNGSQIATTTGATTYTDTGLMPGVYSYAVTAVDAAGNVSSVSGSKSATIYASKDLNRDGVVGIADLTIVLNNFGKSGAGVTGDANGDSLVNIQDIGTLLGAWGTAG